MVDGRVMPIGRPAPIVDGTSATKLTHEDSVPISPSDELRVVLAVKRASGIPVVKNLCKLLLPALPRNYVQQTGVALNTDTSDYTQDDIHVPVPQCMGTGTYGATLSVSRLRN